MTKEELRAYEIASLSKIIPGWDGLSISVKAVIETSFNLEWWRGYHAPKPETMRHVRMCQPAPEGDTHVIIDAADYEQWRDLLAMERQLTLAQAAELQRVKALAKSAEVRFAEDRDDQDLALRDAMRRLAELETVLRDLLDVSFPAIGADPDTEKYLRQKYDEFTEQAKNLLGIKDTEA